MIEYLCQYELWLGDVCITPTETITLEDDFIEDEEELRDVLQEILREQIGCIYAILIDFESIVDKSIDVDNIEVE